MSRFDDTPVGGDGHGNPHLVRAPKTLDADRARGALLGMAVGDALGTTLEFRSIPATPFDPPLTGPHDDVTGGGPFNVVAGQVTDDTQMATALARSLMEEGGFEADKVGAAYVAWSRPAFDIGNQTRSTLNLVARGTPALDAGRAVWIDSGRNAAGNGSLMRTAPIALFYQPDAPRRREVSMQDAAITHFDPRCQLACAAFNGAIAAAIHGPPKSPAELMAAAREDLDLGHAELLRAHPADSKAIDAARVALSADLDAAEADDPDLYGAEVNLSRMQGFVRVAFRLAFWQLMHADSWDGALIDVVNRGGDADTNGAIVGALLGARMGASAIPAAWRDRVTNALAGDEGPWGTTYHPRRLLELLPE